MTTAHYRLLTTAGEPSEDGSADVVVADGTFVLTPKAGDVLRVPFGQIASVAEGEQFTLRIGLAQGTVIELSRMGAMRTQVLAELRDAHADAAAQTASAVGEADIFTGFAGGEKVELRVYDDALLVIGPAATQRVSFSFVTSVSVADYVVTVQAAGSDAVTLTRLGNRTGEFDRALSDRVASARGRTSAFLGALLPGLDPMSLRQAAGLLRDGVAVPVSTLTGVHAELAGTLIEVAALPERRPVLAELAQRGELAIGFRQITSVHNDAVGVTAWRDSAATPHLGEHESPGGTFRPGFAGMMAAGVMAGGPGGIGGFGLGGFGGGYGGGYGGGPYGYRDGWDYGDYWAYRALGAGMNNASQTRQMSTRPSVTRGTLTPASEDFSALRIGGEEPTVLAFALASVPGRVVFEVLNLAEPPTLVFRAAGSGQEATAVINRALVDSGFAPPAAAKGGLTAPARRVGEPALLTDLFVGQAPHDENWLAQLSSLLTS